MCSVQMFSMEENAFQTKVNQYIHNVINQEFNGDIRRGPDNVYYSKTEKSHFEESEKLPFLFFVDASPLFIVKHYKILSIAPINSSECCVNVEFDDLIYSIGSGSYGKHPRRLIEKSQKNIRKYYIVSKNGILYLKNPPHPSLSLEATISLYLEIFQSNRIDPSLPISKDEQDDIKFYKTWYNFILNVKNKNN